VRADNDHRKLKADPIRCCNNRSVSKRQGGSVKTAVRKVAQDDRHLPEILVSKSLFSLPSLCGALLLLPVMTPMATANAATPSELLGSYRTQSGNAEPDPSRGQQFFNASQGHEWRCASCHGAVPTQTGRHAATGKPIAPLAPAFNPERFTDAWKTEKWLCRNCNDVVGRECSAAEKADLLAWLLTLKP
jgi:hypothetical protein